MKKQIMSYVVILFISLAVVFCGQSSDSNNAPVSNNTIEEEQPAVTECAGKADHPEWNGAAGKWLCVEYETKLNTPDNNGGLTRVWINGQLDIEILNQNFVENFTAYGINCLYLESHWNAGSPNTEDQSRIFDNIIVSTQRIGMY